MKSLESYTCHTDLECSEREVSQNTKSSLDLPLESLSCLILFLCHFER